MLQVLLLELTGSFQVISDFISDIKQVVYKTLITGMYSLFITDYFDVILFVD